MRIFCSHRGGPFAWGALTVLALAITLVAFPGHARAAARASVPARLAASPGRGQARALPVDGVSVGSPTEGHLLGGRHVEQSSALRVFPYYAGSDVRWGLGQLVAMIDRSARAVRKRFPDSVLNVGQLSRRGGGEVDRHASHESGRDADIGFYVKSITGKPLLADRLVPFRGDGTSPQWPGAYFDDARNWALVSSWLTDPRAQVLYIFVSTPLRARLLAYAAKIGAPAAIRMRAAERLAQPHGSLPHDDHFHVRIGCPSGMRECVQYPAISKARLAAIRAATKQKARAARAAIRREKTKLDAKLPAPRNARASRDPRAGRDDAVEPPLTPPSGKGGSRGKGDEPGLVEGPAVDESPTSPSVVIPAPIDDVDGPLQD